MENAIVTGSTKGIGKSIGKRLLSEGCFVIFNYASNDAEATALKEELSSYNGKFAVIKSNLSSMEGLEDFYKKTMALVENIDYIVINAGATNRKSMSDITFSEWQYVMNVNINIPFFIAQKFKTVMNDDGRIIFISSILSQYPHASSTVYGVSKAGVSQLAKCLVKDFCDKKITVNAVCPGFVDTPWQLNKPLEQRKRIEDKTALHRFARPEEIAELVYDIIKNQYINGSVINIDGGYDFR